MLCSGCEKVFQKSPGGYLKIILHLWNTPDFIYIHMCVYIYIHIYIYIQANEEYKRSRGEKKIKKKPQEGK